MKIAIDARLYGLKHTGIGRYVQNLVFNLSKIDHKNQYTLLVSSPKKLPPLPKNFHILEANVPHYSFSEQTKFLSIINSLKTDLTHFTHFNVPILYSKPFVVTIHDLLWHEKIGLSATTLSPAKYLFKYFGYRITIKNAIKRAKKVLTPTKQVSQAISEKFSISESQLKVTYEASSPEFKPAKSQSTSILKQHNLNLPLAVYTGSLYPHKNVPLLIDAVLLNKNLNLAIVSSRNVFHQKISDYVNSVNGRSQIKLLGFLPDQDLVKLYQHATALIQPSLSEGFGLTGLEAMASGLPVICSNNSVLKEVYGDAALYTDTSSPAALSQSINSLVIDKPKRMDLIRKGLVQVKKYSWEKTARQTLSVYREVVGTSIK